MKQSERAEKRQKIQENQDQVFQKDWNRYMDARILSEDEKQQIWSAICRKRGSRKHRRAVRTGLGAAAAVACICLLVAGGTQAGRTTVIESVRRSGGDEILDTLRRLCGMEPESVQILQNRTPETAVYAPPLLDCDEERVIFANSRGMAVYDRKRQSVTATIDLQEIGCCYFTADSMQTKVLVEGSQIRIFNTKDGEVTGSCYVYELPEPSEEAVHLKPQKVEKADDALHDAWEQKMNSRYQYSAAYLDNGTVQAWEESEKDTGIKYSKNSVTWTQKGARYTGCLLLCGDKYQLYTKNEDTGEALTEPLHIAVSKEAADEARDANTLPAFAYAGEDPIVKAVCEYMIKEEHIYRKPGISYVYIPVPILYEIVEEEEKIKVFGSFYSGIFYKNGNILVEDAGGYLSACIHLEKKNGAYHAVQVEKSGDGSHYEKGIRAFCQGRQDIYEKFFDYEKQEELHRKTAIEMIGQYVKDNQLDIRYYQEYGQDPVALFADEGGSTKKKEN
ncbi:MAG: hypothetical protein K2N87_04540 [Eubacterium sp.]|nr:hypothetical protein [Eubacterium sp.]